MHWIRKIFRFRQQREAASKAATFDFGTTVDEPLIIESPRIGFLNLLGASAETNLADDEAALAPLFSSSEKSETTPPRCDVLMIYARVDADGRITGSLDTLREIIRQSEASIAVISSENEGKNYIAAARAKGLARANLVMTIRRKGNASPQFLAQVFRRMSRGQSMPLAWVELAPQNPTAVHQNCPESVFSAEVGHIVFK
jgi:hypothetical protein